MELGVDCVWNADQSTVNYETIPNKTLDNIGTKTIWTKTAGKEKERISVLLLACSNGEKRKTFLIFKGKSSILSKTAEYNTDNNNGFGARVWREVKEIFERINIQFYCNQKGWFTDKIMVAWLQFF